MLDIEEKEITSGSLFRSLVFITIPILAQNAVTVAQSIVDLFWIGRISSAAVTAYGIVGPIVGLLLASVIPISYVGTQITVSNHVGGGETDLAYTAFYNGILVAAVVGIIASIISFFLTDELIRAFLSIQSAKHNTHLFDMASSYLRVISAGLFIVSISDTIESGFVGHGNTKIPLYMNVLTVISNIILSPILIFGVGPFPYMGIRGAAIGTVSSYVISLFSGIVFIWSSRTPEIVTRNHLQIKKASVRNVCDVGAPVSGQHAVRHLGSIAFVGLIFAIGGSAALAAYVVVSRISSLAFVPAQGIQTAVQTVISQNIGAGNTERANRTTKLGIFLSAGILTLALILQVVFPEQLISYIALDISGKPLELSVSYMTIYAYSYPALAALYILQGGFNAAHRSRISFISSLVQYWGLRFPIALFGGFLLSDSVILAFWAVAVSNIVTPLFLGLYYRIEYQRGLFSSSNV